MQELNTILAQLKALENPVNVLGMRRFGIAATNAFGVTMPQVRAIAKQYKNNTLLAKELWRTNIHEARILAPIIASKGDFDEQTMDEWTYDFNSWDTCDQACGNLFRYLPFVHKKITEYAKSDLEFVRRTAFALLAGIAVKSKQLKDEDFAPYFSLIEEYATDERNYVCKAVNWALRQMGKRSKVLRYQAVELATILANDADKTARWIGKDALRELQNPMVIERIKD
ncbi:MAG: DNA alkylation repair protein [Bacteroidales bacterium]